MTYWAREHQTNIRKLDDIASALDAQIDYIDDLRRELADDNYDATQDSRARLEEARHQIRLAQHDIDRARAELPTPVQEGSR